MICRTLMENERRAASQMKFVTDFSFANAAATVSASRIELANANALESIRAAGPPPHQKS
jgi:hypothetical protein